MATTCNSIDNTTEISDTLTFSISLIITKDRTLKILLFLSTHKKEKRKLHQVPHDLCFAYTYIFQVKKQNSTKTKIIHMG